MRKKNTVLFLGIASILILVTVQAYLILNIWKQKSDSFAIRYGTRSNEAYNYIKRNLETEGFDTVKILLNEYSEKAYKELQTASNAEDFAAKKKYVLDYFTKLVNKEQDLSALLSSYFESRKMES